MKKRTVVKSCFIAGLTALVLLLTASCAFAETNGYPVKITINEPVEKVEAGLHMNIRGGFLLRN